ncbi:chemotaxis protein CheW [Aquabacterium sp.]|uniref:chemotaxis protein CheW n=1 Tax=Aquabacterium sp. TaxID=1872578 RepID=UPI002C55DFCD|nr:chemotaxis protein CheW [Aquabacterium sp.]HSW08917.1 chemotaxis protein CheW [Aquabacterium sp.]
MNAVETAAPVLPAATHPPSVVSRTPSAREQARECLTFRLGDEEYGIDILKVQEIRGYESPTRIANAPAFFKGVLNLRGVIVPIIDLRLNLRLELAAYDAFTVTVILNVAGRVVGAVVDSVSDVIDLAPGQIHPAPEFNGAVDARYINGIGTIDQGERKRMLILIDIERLISSADVGLIEQTLQ